jgi:hypothetical protein
MLHHNFPSQAGFDVIQKEAKKLFHALQRKDIAVLQRYDPFAILGDVSHARLADAQYVIARRYGFRSWARMKETLVRCTGRTTSIPSPIPALKKLATFKQALDADPTDAGAAIRYWVAPSSVAGNDVRSGAYLIEAFRRCALDSTAGVVALVRGYRELFEISGERPRPALFDTELLQALRARLPELSNNDRASAQWVLSFAIYANPKSVLRLP